MQLTLGPVQFNWDPEVWRDFYFRIADEAPVDTVVTGEVVCSKRKPFLDKYLPDVLERLSRAGKKVYVGSLVLVTLERERRQTSDLMEQEEFPVEVNDLTCLVGTNGKPHSIGPFINTYNEATAAYFVRNGATRICLPPELPLPSIEMITKAVPETEIEVFAFGRAPLAISARCYHARLHNLTKDNCQFVCDKDLDGLTVDTLDGEHFLAMNGVQTLSHSSVNLLNEAAALEAMGVKALRLSPQTCDMVSVARIFRDVLDGRSEPEEGTAALQALWPEAVFTNGFAHGIPGSQWVAGKLAAQSGA